MHFVFFFPSAGPFKSLGVSKPYDRQHIAALAGFRAISIFSRVEVGGKNVHGFKTAIA
jgi:hypothetical protein